MSMNRKNAWEKGPVDGWNSEEKGRCRRLPMSVIRNIAHASHAGGRAECYFCRTWFSANFVRLYYVSFKQQEFSCAQCAKARKLQGV
jgi:hypothetical protein